MTVSLTPELEQLVAERVASGQYPSASEVIDAALRLLQERDQQQQVREQELRREIQLGLDDLEAGRAVTFNDNTLPELVHTIQSDGRKRRAAPQSDPGT